MSDEDTQEDPTSDQDIKIKRTNLGDQFYMTRPGKRHMTRLSYMTRAGREKKRTKWPRRKNS